MDEIEKRLREIGTPEEQLKGISMLLMVLCDNDSNQVCKELDRFRNKV